MTPGGKKIGMWILFPPGSNSVHENAFVVSLKLKVLRFPKVGLPPKFSLFTLAERVFEDSWHVKIRQTLLFPDFPWYSTVNIYKPSIFTIQLATPPMTMDPPFLRRRLRRSKTRRCCRNAPRASLTGHLADLGGKVVETGWQCPSYTRFVIYIYIILSRTSYS